MSFRHPRRDNMTDLDDHEANRVALEEHLLLPPSESKWTTSDLPWQGFGNPVFPADGLYRMTLSVTYPTQMYVYGGVPAPDQTVAQWINNTGGGNSGNDYGTAPCTLVSTLTDVGIGGGLYEVECYVSQSDLYPAPLNEQGGAYQFSYVLEIEAETAEYSARCEGDGSNTSVAGYFYPLNFKNSIQKGGYRALTLPRRGGFRRDNDIHEENYKALEDWFA